MSDAVYEGLAREPRLAALVAGHARPQGRAQARLAPRKRIPYGRALGPLTVLCAWALLSGTGAIDDRLVPAPWTVLADARQLAADGYLQENLLASLRRASIGLGFGLAAGVILAVIAGLSRFGDALIDGPVQIKRAIPSLGLIPLMILWFGIGESMKLIVIASSVLVPVYINTHAGITGIDARFVELAETVRLSRAGFIRRVVIPGALPGFFLGLRLAVTSSWIGLVVVEQINADSGLGFLMVQAQQYGQTGIIFVGLVLYGAFGWLADCGVRQLEGRALAWRRTLAR